MIDTLYLNQRLTFLLHFQQQREISFFQTSLSNQSYSPLCHKKNNDMRFSLAKSIAMVSYLDAKGNVRNTHCHVVQELMTFGHRLIGQYFR